MWAHILTSQLDVTAAVFWRCVREGKLPDRGGPSPVLVKKAVPLHLVIALREFGVDENDILERDAVGAAALLAAKYRELHNE
ncbi:hypothetical protein D9V32_06265 [Mycetocola tolaasinivorans]|uniref:Uncharacterized protein n=2 Tax=Mycetocola tolaasinivorans TaxID=76635 RepID=A0A3L7AA01_9MICO|nr:hypothetical protein D9V32_06265 [Mycetocola tolaasinivorans]